MGGLQLRLGLSVEVGVASMLGKSPLYVISFEIGNAVSRRVTIKNISDKFLHVSARVLDNECCHKKHLSSIYVVCACVCV